MNGEHDAPTMADYAWSSANEAKEQNRALRALIEKLENRVTKLEETLRQHGIYHD